MKYSSIEILGRQHAWLQKGAVEKSRSIEMLAEGLGICSVLEVGSGTGAILAQLDSISFAEHYYACEPAEDLARYMVDAVPISRLRQIEISRLDESSFRDKRFDLVVLSHVLEHLDSPAELLAQCLRIGDYVLVEVPLEGSVGGNSRAWIKEKLMNTSRSNNSAGHIQYFSLQDVNKMIRWTGGDIVRKRLYTPTYSSNRVDTQMRRRFFTLGKRVGRQVVGEDRWSRHYYGHYAVLARRTSGTAHGHQLYFANTTKP